MNKLTKSDIKILGEGPQIARLIKAKYNNIEDFYKSNNTPFTLNSLRTYLSRNVITSDSFKCAITNIFDMDFYQIALSPKTQISSFVHNIYDNILLYASEEDAEVLDYVLDLCRQEGMLAELSMMYRAKARNCYYTNKINHTEEFYDYAIDLLPRHEVNKRTYYNSELAYDFFRENMISKAEKRYDISKEYITQYKEKLDSVTLYSYYYWRGILYLVYNMYDTAMEFFETAIKYAQKNYEKASSIGNIGLIYKKQKDYVKALDLYEEALTYFDASRITTTGAIYNNIAELYRTIGDYRNALIYIHRAFDINDQEYSLTKHLAFIATYAEIQMELGSYLSYNAYFDVLLSTKDKCIDKSYVIQSIKSFICNANNAECLNKLTEVILELKASTASSGYIKGLYECLGYIHEKLILLSKGGIE